MIKDTFKRLSPEKKETIIENAHVIFAEQGFDGVTVRDIVKATGISRGSFYQYFDTTIDVFKVCLEDVTHKKLKFMAPFMEEAGARPFLSLYRTLIEKGIDFSFKHPIESKSALVLYNTADYALLELKKDLETQGIDMLQGLIHKDQTAGFMSNYIDSAVLARMLYHFNAYDLIEKLKQGLNKTELIQYADGFLNIIENGIQ